MLNPGAPDEVTRLDATFALPGMRWSASPDTQRQVLDDLGIDEPVREQALDGNLLRIDVGGVL
jgi:hypothetical protein